MTPSKPPFILTGANLYDPLSGQFSRGQSILITDGIITHVGQFSECISISPKVPEITSLKGKVILPAFTDTHTHVVELAKARIMVDLSGCHSTSEIASRLTDYRARQSSLPPWILGGAWDINLLDDPSALNKHLLDSIFPDIPVALWSKDYHAKLCNSLALKLAGLSASSPDPPGGVLQRDFRGELTGILYEGATLYLEQFIKQPNAKLITRALEETVAEARALGINSIHTMEGAASWAIVEKYCASHQDCRFTWHFPPEELDHLAEAGLASHSGDARLRIGALKLFADGALGSCTAATFNPYPDGSNGILRYTDAELYEQAEAAAARGFAVAIHAIGDRAVHQVLSTFKRLNEHYPNPGHRIEHIQSIRPQDLSLLASSAAFCAIQPLHLASDIPNLERHWHSTKSQAFALKDIIAHAAGYAFGSDAPIESFNPFHAIYTALSRKPALDPTQESWMPGQSLSLREAIYGYTYGAARISHREHELGLIRPGYLADLMILPDFSQAPPEFWLDAKPELVDTL